MGDRPFEALIEQARRERAAYIRRVLAGAVRSLMAPFRRLAPAIPNESPSRSDHGNCLGEQRALDTELERSFGLSMSEIRPLLAAGGDVAERKFMQCCRRLRESNGAELVARFVDATFNDLPEKSRLILFQQALATMLAAQGIAVKTSGGPACHQP